MRIEDMTEIGNVLYRRGADGTLYPVQRMRPDTAPHGYAPPDTGLLDMLNGTGIPERAGQFNQMLNPVEAIGGSMGASQRMMSPDATGWDRVQALGDMLSGVAGVAAPMAGAARAGAPGATALMEGLLGWSPTREAAGNAARDVAERLNQPGPVPTMYSNPVLGLLGDVKTRFDVARQDASNIFGAGAERVRYTDPKSKGTIELLVRPDGSASVLELEVPEVARGQGIGQRLQQIAMQDYPLMGGQVSSKAAAKTAYRLGRRPPGKPEASLEDVFKEIDNMSSVNMVAPAMQARFIPPKIADPAIERANGILDLIKTGRANEVTDQMLDMGDPVLNTRLNEHLWNNYDLPMDYASRMARAIERGAVEEFHGTTTGGSMRYPSPSYGSGSRKGIGFVTSSNPYVSSSYADPSFGTVFPMLNETPIGGFTLVGTNGDLWSAIPGQTQVKLPSGFETSAANYAAMTDDVSGGLRTDHIARGAAIEGHGGVKFNRIVDRGVHAPRVKDDPSVMLNFQKKASEPSDVMFRQDTRGMRSRFARFDPRLAHLKNLSAGVAGAGLLAMQPSRDNQQ